MARLIKIPDDDYSEYRYNVIFKGYKWDPQVGDHSTVARHAVVISREEADMLNAAAEKLAAETMALEEAFCARPAAARSLQLPRKISSALSGIRGYDRERHVRLMRFDFHPTLGGGWSVSEVNSDVPGGFAEASVMPRLASEYFDGLAAGINFADELLGAFSRKAGGGNIAFVHCTSYSDDRQVMQFIGEKLEASGGRAFFAAPEHLSWTKDGRASIMSGGGKIPLDGIIRFFPLEWLITLPRASGWRGYFNSQTTSCNHPVSMYTQSKRLPLAWDNADVGLTAWKTFLPRTVSPTKRLIETSEADGYILKPALGRVGEGIGLREAIPAADYKKIVRAATRHPREWLLQKKFISRPLIGDDGSEFHMCLGVFAIDGKAAGFYARISRLARIDSVAQDVPVLIDTTKGEYYGL